MLVGYTRVSKADGSQTTDLQRDALLAAGTDPDSLYEDKASGKKGRSAAAGRLPQSPAPRGHPDRLEAGLRCTTDVRQSVGFFRFRQRPEVGCCWS